MDNEKKPTHKETVVHMLDENNEQANEIPMKKSVMILVLVISLGVITGFTGSFFSTDQKSSGKAGSKGSSAAVKQKAGIADKKTFKDSAEGILKAGGIEGEGEYHLERPGGESQNVYLTSTTVDLSEYINQKVKVLGETFSAEKAGWFMDVGFIEVSE